MESNFKVGDIITTETNESVYKNKRLTVKRVDNEQIYFEYDGGNEDYYSNEYINKNFTRIVNEKNSK